VTKCHSSRWNFWNLANSSTLCVTVPDVYAGSSHQLSLPSSGPVCSHLRSRFAAGTGRFAARFRSSLQPSSVSLQPVRSRLQPTFGRFAAHLQSPVLQPSSSQFAADSSPVCSSSQFAVARAAAHNFIKALPGFITKTSSPLIAVSTPSLSVTQQLGPL